jgi:hypothetical protein
MRSSWEVAGGNAHILVHERGLADAAVSENDDLRPVS